MGVEPTGAGIADARTVLEQVDRAHSFSNPWLVNFRSRLISVTVRTTWSGAPDGISAPTSSVAVTRAPTIPAWCVITSSVLRLASRPTRVLSSATDPWKHFGTRSLQNNY